jgi:hypothetical protein
VATGGSRLVQIDLETRLPRVVFPRPSTPLPGAFYTYQAGQIDLGDSDRALLTIYASQKIWEVNLKTGEVLWEYLCVDPQEHHRRPMLNGKYVRQASFPLNRQGESRP